MSTWASCPETGLCVCVCVRRIKGSRPQCPSSVFQKQSGWHRPCCDLSSFEDAEYHRLRAGHPGVPTDWPISSSTCHGRRKRECMLSDLFLHPRCLYIACRGLLYQFNHLSLPATPRSSRATALTVR